MVDRPEPDVAVRASRARRVVIGKQRPKPGIRRGTYTGREVGGAVGASRRRLARQRLLTGLNRLISASLDMDDVLKALAQAAATLMGAAVASFWVVDDEATRLIREIDGEHVCRGSAALPGRRDERLSREADHVRAVRVDAGTLARGVSVAPG